MLQLSEYYTKERAARLFFFEKPVLLVILGLILTNFVGYGVYWCFLLVPFFILNLYSNISLIDRNFILILLFSILYSLFLVINDTGPSSNALLLTYLFGPPVFYFYGKFMIRQYPGPSTVYFLFFYICFLFSILPFVANVRSVMQNGFMTVRSINLIWMDQQQGANATNIGSTFALNLSLLPLLFTERSGKNRHYILISLFLVVIAVFSILNMLNRTGLGIMVLSAFVYIFYSGNKIRSAIFVSILVFAIALFYSFDLMGFQTWFQYSSYYDRLSQTGVYEQGSRFMIWKGALDSFIKYPLGVTYYNVKYMIGASYAHNFWLDVGLRSGFMPLIPLLIVTVRGLLSVGKVVFNKRNDEFLRVIIAGFAVGFYVTFFVEPIMEGYSVLFYFYCFYLGAIEAVKEYM